MSNKKNLPADLQGITRMLTDASLGITDIVQAMQKQIVHPFFLPSTPAQEAITNLSGFVFNNIRWSTRFFGTGLDKTLGKLAVHFRETDSSPEREIFRAVLNGVIGDYLEETNNPLQIKMEFRKNQKGFSPHPEVIKRIYPKVNGKILLLIHGSCMNDALWKRKDHDHGLALSNLSGQTTIYINYNSGRHISANGQELNNQLESLIKNWPVPIEDFTILAHSMGGLVARSAVYYGKETKNSWTKKLKKMIFLGTPHHGAPLEQAGNYLDLILETIPYTKPFARLGRIRSAGVTDLRFGNLITEDWKNIDRFKLEGDQRKTIPLPTTISCYSIAGVISKQKSSLASEWLGDKMVPVKSALGKHKDPNRKLKFKKKNTWIAYEHSHVDLLSSQNVFDKLVEWMGADSVSI